LAPYRISCEGRPGLIFGYATLGERALAEGIEILAKAICDVRSRCEGELSAGVGPP
jgi:GntR family transcriptional regulator/MocR family aminotransferase